MNESVEIKDYDTYNHRMRRSMIDKLFFVDKIDPDIILDFGCADGALLQFIKHFFPEKKVVGYDNDPNMAKYGTETLPIKTDWNDIVKFYLNVYKTPAIILSSVIHEVLNYTSKLDIDRFWNMVFNSNFKYIVIRDTIPCKSVDRPSHMNDVLKIYRKFFGSKELTDFEREWGSIENNKNLIHFLLKYKYIHPNWDREVRENYLPVNREDLLRKIPVEYEILFHEHYTLPYLYQSVKSEIGIEIKDFTHLKLILVKK